ncbi:hypothetical protein [Microcoleus sp. herbarium7]|uniref:hypothetical protein n=1 Tax=Microcoleus sp. herbarium7 TaxID=3055435 RepID=UPI002FD19E6D
MTAFFCTVPVAFFNKTYAKKIGFSIDQLDRPVQDNTAKRLPQNPLLPSHRQPPPCCICRPRRSGEIDSEGACRLI